MAMVQHHRSLTRPMAPVCSVCIANYNGEALLDDCLSSIFAQQGNINVEVIIHDDASTDGSVSLLRTKYSQVEVLESTRNVGFCISNNRMVEQARGEYILLLNNDAALFPDALQTLVNAAHAAKEPGIFSLPQYDWECGQLVDRGCLLDPFYNPVPNLDPKRCDVAMVIGACMFMPRALWCDLGGFPEWFESIGEDLYLCCLARLRGAQVLALPKSGFRHRLGTSFGGARIAGQKLSTTLRRRRLSERNKTFVLFACMPTAKMWLTLLVHIVSLLFEGALLSLLRLDWRIFIKVYACVPCALVREYKRLLALRRQVQTSRTADPTVYFRAFTKFPYKVLLLCRFGVPRVGA